MRWFIAVFVTMSFCLSLNMAQAAQSKKDRVEEYLKQVESSLLKLEKVEGACVDKTNGGDFEINECQKTHIEALDKIYESIMRAAKKVVSEKLFTIISTDSNSFEEVRKQFVSDAWDGCGGGTMSRLCAASAYMWMTEERIKWLGHIMNSYIDDQE
jgi:hypothetical protein